jgi:hypothetical protein
MRDISKPLLVVFGAWAVIDGLIFTGFLFVIGVMFIVMGNTPGRLIGVGLLALLLMPWGLAVRRRYCRSVS